MNVTHLKYAVEVNRTGSISKAADNLYMSQPNLSKAIKELEASIGFLIFKRTSKGITTTTKGVEFLEYAKALLAQMEVMENLYAPGMTDKQSFSVCAPRASYIAHTMTKFVNILDRDHPIDISFVETNSMNALANVCDGDANIGIVRYQEDHESFAESFLNERGATKEIYYKFEHLALVSENNPVAKLETVTYSDLINQIELVHRDEGMPFVPAKKKDNEDNTKKKIYVCERGSQFDFLRKVSDSYMWVSPCPDELLKQYGLVQKKCTDNGVKYVDAIIFEKNHRLSDYETQFISMLKQTIREIVNEMK